MRVTQCPIDCEMARPLSHFLGAIVTTSSRRSTDDDDDDDDYHDDEDPALQLHDGGFSAPKLEFGNQLSSDASDLDPFSSCSLSSGIGQFLNCKY